MALVDLDLPEPPGPAPPRQAGSTESPVVIPISAHRTRSLLRPAWTHSALVALRQCFLVGQFTIHLFGVL